MRTDNRESVGVFLDSHAITVVQARSLGGRVDVLKRGAAEVPAGAVEGAAIRDPFRVSQALRALLHEMNLPARTVSVALSSEAYSVRSVRLPEVPASERRALVRNELEDTGVLPPRSGTLDFLWLPAPSEPGKRQVDAVTYYASDQHVDEFRDTLRQAGMALDRIEPDSVSMMRGFIASQPTPEPVAILCLARKHSDLCIHDGQKLRSMRRIPSGWEDVLSAPRAGRSLYLADTDTEAITSPRDPESMAAPETGQSWPYYLGTGHSRSQGYWPTALPEAAAAQDSASSRLNGDDITPTVPSSLAPDTEFLASEVSRSLAFFAREYPDAARPQSIVVLGPASIVNTLSSLLDRVLPLPVRSEDPLAAQALPRPVLLPGNQISEGFLQALGVALEASEATIPAVDLSQQEEKVRAGKRAPAMLLKGMAASTVWMIGAAVAAIALTLMETGVQTESSRLAQKVSRIKLERAPLQRRQEVETAARTAAATARLPVASVLGRVAASTLPGVMLTRLVITPDGLLTIDGSARDTTDISKFADSLGSGLSIRDVHVIRGSLDNQARLTFKLTGAAKRAASPPTAH